MNPTLLALALLLAAPAALAQRQTAAPATAADVPPVFPGGTSAGSMARFNHFLLDSLKTPPKARRDKVYGQVLVGFSVDSAGRTQDIKIAKGLRTDVDSAVLRQALRLRRIRWQPALHEGKPAKVDYTMPVAFTAPAPPRTVTAPPDSLDGNVFPKIQLPLAAWEPTRAQIPPGRGLVYGAALARPGLGSLGPGQSIALANLTTRQLFRLKVLPAPAGQPATDFVVALPAGRYAPYLYEFPDSEKGGYATTAEQLHQSAPAAADAPVRASRYVFTVVAGQVQYVGTWDLSQPFKPAFRNEKPLTDARLRPGFGLVKFEGARVAVPK